MAFEHYITQGGKRLRCGYTTGTCAALAAKAAAFLLLTGEMPKTVSLLTPKGLLVEVSPEEQAFIGDAARCAVRKDGGDDCDATDGLLICAEVSRIPETEFRVDGGAGVGRVTRPGLEQPVGSAAINRVPREMIRNALREAARACGHAGGLAAVITVPDGKQVAQKTFNPNLGIVGGISILGTSGIVEPQSIQALVDTIRIEIEVRAAAGEKKLLITPGNYGENFLKTYPALSGVQPVKCSNFIGDTLDFAVSNGVSTLMLVGHIGKFVKLAGGIMNTHSRYADCRAELFAAHAALAGAETSLIRKLMDSNTTDESIALLDSASLREPVLNSLMERAMRAVRRRAAGAEVGMIWFSNRYGFLKASENVEKLCREWSL